MGKLLKDDIIILQLDVEMIDGVNVGGINFDFLPIDWIPIGQPVDWRMVPHLGDSITDLGF